MNNENECGAKVALNELLGVKREKALAHLDKCINTHAKLTFARERYDEAEAEQHGIAVLDLIDQYGIVLREALANAGEIERLRKAYWKMRNVAAGYSNLCDDRRLERDYEDAESLYRTTDA